MKRIITKNILKSFSFLLVCVLFTQCQFNYFTKPRIKKIEKSEDRSSASNYNFYKFYGNAFESQPGKNPESIIHLKFNHIDSSYTISLEDYESSNPKKHNYQGKYTVNKNGFIQLLADSPFEKNQLQVIMWHGVHSQLVKFEFNDQFKKRFPRNSKSAYCEAQEFSLEDCIIL